MGDKAFEINPGHAPLTLPFMLSGIGGSFYFLGNPEKPGRLYRLVILKVRCYMRKVVLSFLVLLWASLYLLARILMDAVRKFREDISPITGEVSLIRSIFLLCIGICAVGYAGVFLALIK